MYYLFISLCLPLYNINDLYLFHSLLIFYPSRSAVVLVRIDQSHRIQNVVGGSEAR